MSLHVSFCYICFDIFSIPLLRRGKIPISLRQPSAPTWIPQHRWIFSGDMMWWSSAASNSKFQWIHTGNFGPLRCLMVSGCNNTPKKGHLLGGPSQDGRKWLFSHPPIYKPFNYRPFGKERTILRETYYILPGMIQVDPHRKPLKKEV